MRAFIIGTVFFLFLLSTPPVAPSRTPQLPQTQKEKESYSIGYQVGTSMKYDGIAVDYDNLLQGLRDAIDGKEPVLQRDDMKRLILDLKKKARETAMRKFQELTVRNAEESAKFLEQNGKKEGVKTTESGLQYRVMKAGNGAAPGPEDSVRVHYRGMFTDGKEFDSSYSKGEPQTVQTDGVIKGWTEALQMMQAGSKWQIFVPPQLAYGRSGLGQTIPPNKVLVFEIELLSVDKKETNENGK